MMNDDWVDFSFKHLGEGCLVCSFEEAQSYINIGALQPTTKVTAFLPDGRKAMEARQLTQLKFATPNTSPANSANQLSLSTASSVGSANPSPPVSSARDTEPAPQTTTEQPPTPSLSPDVPTSSLVGDTKPAAPISAKSRNGFVMALIALFCLVLILWDKMPKEDPVSIEPQTSLPMQVGPTEVPAPIALDPPVEPPPSLDPLLASPKVGDVWAGELTAFSSYEFSGGSSEMNGNVKAYGLMRVVDVSVDRVTIITETGAWPEVRGAVRELRGDMADVTWDENERIPIYRSELAQLLAEGKISETRRLSDR